MLIILEFDELVDSRDAVSKVKWLLLKTTGRALVTSAHFSSRAGLVVFGTSEWSDRTVW